MPIAKSFDKDIFISYCHDDNVNPMAKQGWVDVFHEALLWRLKQRLGRDNQAPEIWRDNSLQGNDSFSDVLAEELNRVALVVSVLTPSYVSSPWCKRELEEFCRAAQAQSGLRVDKKLRILKVLKTPVDRDKHPAMLQGEIGFPFYAPGRDPANPREYTLADGDENAALAQRAIDDLAFSIQTMLEAINQATDAAPGAAPPGGPGATPAATPTAAPSAAPTAAPAFAGTTVYLAECHWGLDEAREQVRRELTALGVTVLPAGELNLRNPQRFREAVQQALQASTLAVHLVSALRGAGVADETDDCVVLQNRLAAERSAASNLQRLVWLPDHLVGEAKADDAAQQRFIEQLERDPVTRQGAETLTMPLQGLITRIHDTLRKQQQAREARQLEAAAAAAAAAVATAATLAAPAAAGEGEPPSIYLLWHPDDEALARSLDDHLYALGFNVLNPLSDPDADEDELNQDHQRKLQGCSAALVCVGKAKESWLSAKLSELQNAVGRRKGSPMAARGVYIGPPEVAYKTRVRAQGLVVCRGSEGFSADQVQAFVDLVRAASAPAA